jgi:hypothetical protein
MRLFANLDMGSLLVRDMGFDFTFRPEHQNQLQLTRLRVSPPAPVEMVENTGALKVEFRRETPEYF